MYYVYILTNSRKNVIYIGVTSHLVGRIDQHKRQSVAGFTQKYRIHHLVYYEEFEYVHDAIGREKQLKGWRRDKKERLIKKQNPRWLDLSAQWYSPLSY